MELVGNITGYLALGLVSLVGLFMLLYAVFVICKVVWDIVQTIRECGAKSSIVMGSIIIAVISALVLLGWVVEHYTSLLG